HAFTYNGHPVGCAVALRNLDIIEQENFCEQAATKGDHLLERLQATLGGHPHVGDVRGKGLMCGVEFVRDRSTGEEFDREEAVGQRIHIETQKRGLFTRVRGDVFCLAPPVVTQIEQLDQIVDVLVDSVNAVLGEG
ncbi:MAG: aspartate aminotransferase family protein, partial [Planctomycetaceae bacterium]|nr:aspartate aminotransferase family protein [Planctomycetaceae bacterium]